MVGSKITPFQKIAKGRRMTDDSHTVEVTLLELARVSTVREILIGYPNIEPIS